MNTGEWKHREYKEKITDLSYDTDYRSKEIDLSQVEKNRQNYLHQAKIAASELQKEKDIIYTADDREVEELKYFYYVHSTQKRAS